MFGNMIGIIFSSSLIFLFIYHTRIFLSNFLNSIEFQRTSAEILYIFNMIKEDIMKSKNLSTEGDVLILGGFLMSLSDDENDKSWGIVINCDENTGKVIVYNLYPEGRIFVWDNISGEIETLPIISKRKLAGETYEVWLPICSSDINGKMVFKDLFEIRWYSEGSRVYREISRYGAKQKAKFFVGEGKIQILGDVIYIKNPNDRVQIRFRI